jgi:hypothetical protein
MYKSLDVSHCIATQFLKLPPFNQEPSTYTITANITPLSTYTVLHKMCVIPCMIKRCRVCQKRLEIVKGFAERCEKYENSYACDNISYPSTPYFASDSECPACRERKKELKEKNDKKA